MKFEITYHPVWAATLTKSEQEKYESLLGQYHSEEQAVSISPITIKRKKNGGIVATVFICNGTDAIVKIDKTDVSLVANKNIVADEQFTPLLAIPSLKAAPWSFVFSPTHIMTNEMPSNDWEVKIRQVN